MGISMYSTPFCLHTGTSSAGSIGLEAVARSRASDLYARVGVLFPEKLRCSLGDRVNGAGPLDADLTGDRLATVLLSAGTAPATSQHERKRHNKASHHKQFRTPCYTQPLHSLRHWNTYLEGRLWPASIVGQRFLPCVTRE